MRRQLFYLPPKRLTRRLKKPLTIAHLDNSYLCLANLKANDEGRMQHFVYGLFILRKLYYVMKILGII